MLHCAGSYDLALGAECAMLAGVLAMRYDDDDDDIDAWTGMYEPRYATDEVLRYVLALLARSCYLLYALRWLRSTIWGKGGKKREPSRPKITNKYIPNIT